MTRGLLYEMAVYSERDVFKMNPVASVSTDVTNNLEGEELRKYIFQHYQTVEIPSKYKIDEHIVGELISHHCGHRKMKKAALLSLPNVINANLVTAPWRRRLGDDGQPVRKNDKRPSGMISAPILIDGVKCLCSLTLRLSKGIITPYSLALKDENGEIIEGEKMEGTISSVPHSSSEPTTIGDAHSVKATTSHDTEPSFQGTKVQQNDEINKNNDIKTEQYMNKKQIRLTESDLKQIIKESVSKILNEAYGTMPSQDKATMWNLNNSKNGGLHGYYNHSIGRHLSSDEVRRGMYDYEKGEEMPTELHVLLHLSDEVKDVLYNQDYIKFIDERLNKVLRKKLAEVSKLCDHLINKAKMNIGQQPDENYFDR